MQKLREIKKMATKKRYRKKASVLITAVQLNLDTQGFTYQKWGDQQRCKAGDWLVDNQGECYTIDKQTFAETYRQVSQGVYRKVQTVWAEVATQAGTVRTKEGTTEYGPGDYLVSNNADGTDDYAISKSTFEDTYEQVED